jgi:hypothetical protein
VGAERPAIWVVCEANQGEIAVCRSSCSPIGLRRGFSASARFLSSWSPIGSRRDFSASARFLFSYHE